MTDKIKVIFFGNERLVSGLNKTDAPLLNGLIKSGYDVVAIVSHHTGGNSRNQRELEVAEIAKAHDIPLFLPNKPSEIMDELKSFGADIAVLSAYGRIIGQQVIDIFPLGIINIHPSLLPKYRGPTPIETTLLNHDTEAGVSIMKLTAGMDEGPVYAQISVPIEKNEDKFHLYDRLSRAGTELFIETFPKIIDGSLKPSEQDGPKATYSRLIQKSDGVIDWTKPAVQLESEIRTYKGWPQSRTKLHSIDVIITDAHVIRESEGSPGEMRVVNDTLLVTTGEGSLSIDRLKPLDKKEMPVSAFLAGYSTKLGI